MLGHTVDKCYKIHGNPPGYKPKGKFSDSVKGQQEKGSYSKPVVNQSGVINEQDGQVLVNNSNGSNGLTTS